VCTQVLLTFEIVELVRCMSAATWYRTW